MIFFCVRHGESAFNAEGRIQGQLDTPLSELGHQQSKAVAAALAEYEIDAIYASPLRRALDTARHVAEVLRLEVLTDPRLQEINAGAFQGLVWEEIQQQFPDAAVRWKSQEPDFRIPGGETRRELMHRGAAVLEEIRRRNHQCVAIVAHGGLLTAAIKQLLGVPAEENPFKLQNCSITQLQWGDRCELLMLNETAHLAAVNGDRVGHSGDL